jgi:hypothetical protein
MNELLKELSEYTIKLVNDVSKYGGDTSPQENLIKLFPWILALGWMVYNSIFPIRNYIISKRNV